MSRVSFVVDPARAGARRRDRAHHHRACAVALCAAAVLGAAGAASAATFPLPPEGEAVVGTVQHHVAHHDDTFVSIARDYGVGYQELTLANPGVDPWLPGEGTQIVIPTRFVLPDAPRRGIVLNVPEMRLYYYPPARAGEPAQVMTFPVSVGRQDWRTPYGLTSVVAKQRDPSWYPPESIREEHAAQGRPLPSVVPPGPDNPLGRHALRLGLPGYLIHGTNMPAGVGMRVTHGCVRMFNDDVATLFAMVPVGERVRIVNQPFKMGWHDSSLYLEVHPPLEEDSALQEKGLTALTELFVSSTDERLWQVDWARMESLYERGLGIPEPLLAEAIEAGEEAAASVDGGPAAAAPTVPAEEVAQAAKRAGQPGSQGPGGR